MVLLHTRTHVGYTYRLYYSVSTRVRAPGKRSPRKFNKLGRRMRGAQRADASCSGCAYYNHYVRVCCAWVASVCVCIGIVRELCVCVCVFFAFVLCVPVCMCEGARGSSGATTANRRRNIVRVHTIIISRGNGPRFARKTFPGRLPAPYAQKRSRLVAADSCCFMNWRIYRTPYNMYTCTYCGTRATVLIWGLWCCVRGLQQILFRFLDILLTVFCIALKIGPIHSVFSSSKKQKSMLLKIAYYTWVGIKYYRQYILYL